MGIGFKHGMFNLNQDLGRASGYFQKACDMGWSKGCEEVKAVRVCENGDMKLCQDQKAMAVELQKHQSAPQEASATLAQLQRRPSSGGCGGPGASGFVVVLLFGLGGIFRRRWS